MNWRTDFPEQSRDTLVTVQLPISQGGRRFRCIAHYDNKQGKWFKYDPWNDKAGEDISHYVIAWADDMVSWLG